MPKTTCGKVVEVKCIDCFNGVKSWCYECTNMELRIKIRQLEAENAFLKKEYDDQFNLTPHLIHKYIKQHLEPQQSPITKHTHFFTITFDPSRFKNLGTNHHLEEQYILHQLAYMIKDGYINEMYGSFELTKDSITHAHVNIRTYQPVDLKQRLKEKFTFNMSNKFAVHSGHANAKSIGYINKIEDGKGTENKTWYTYKESVAHNIAPVPDPLPKVISEEISFITDLRESLDFQACLENENPPVRNEISSGGLLTESERRKRLGLVYKNGKLVEKKISSKLFSNV